MNSRTVSTALPVHELAKIFPPIPEAEFSELKADIAANGQQVPVVITADNMVLDGQHRQKALQELGRTDMMADVLPDDTDLIKQVVALNINRRHLLTSQRAVVADRLSEYSVHGRNQHSGGPEKFPIQTQSQAAEMLNVTDRTVRDVRKVRQSSTPLYEAVVSSAVAPSDAARVADKPEPVIQEALRVKQKESERKKGDEPVRSRTLTDIVKNIEKRESTIKTREWKAEQIEQAQASAPVPKATLYHLPISELHKVVPAGSVDAIITDPPYRMEDLYVWKELADFAAHALTPNGNMVAMSGHAHIPKVLEGLSSNDDIVYYWTLCVQMIDHPNLLIRTRNVLTAWKPIFWYRRPNADKPWAGGDVMRSPYQKGREDTYHEWGQSLTNFTDLCKRFALAGKTVCDPFLGGGTTAVAALMNGNQFIGADIKKENIDTTKDRMNGELDFLYELEVK